VKKDKKLKIKRKLIPIGSSRGIIIPKEILELAKIKESYIEIHIKLK